MASAARSIFIEADDQGSPNGRPTGFPALHYRSALPARAQDIERHFASNGWEPAWRYPMYRESHYHSTCHEALGVYQGRAKLLLGGDKGKGVEIEVEAGDVLVLPAGYAHRSLEDHDGFKMVGAYPKNRVADWDMCYGRSKEEGDEAEKRIREWALAKHKLPSDPVEGDDAVTSLRQAWIPTGYGR